MATKKFLVGIDAPFVTGLDDPLLPADAATKKYVDDQIKGKYMKRIIDEVSETTMYIGEAQPGSVETDPVWSIKRVQFIGEDIFIFWANGTNQYNNIWNNRLSYTYS